MYFLKKFLNYTTLWLFFKLSFIFCLKCVKCYCHPELDSGSLQQPRFWMTEGNTFRCKFRMTVINLIVYKIHMEQQIADLLKEKIKENYDIALDNIRLEVPPKKELWDFAFGCFVLSRDLKKNPTQIAMELKKILNSYCHSELVPQGHFLRSFRICHYNNSPDSESSSEWHTTSSEWHTFKFRMNNNIFYLKNLFQINLSAIFTAFTEPCHFFKLYSVYFILTGTSINFISFFFISSTSSDA